MSVTSHDKYKPTIKRSTLQIYQGLMWFFIACTLVLLIVLLTGSTTDTQLRDTFVARLKQEDAATRDAASQIPRIGASNTYHMLALTRQHTYAMQQINELSVTLLGAQKGLVGQSDINAVLSILDRCEELLLAGHSLEEPLNEIWPYLNSIRVTIEAL